MCPINGRQLFMSFFSRIRAKVSSFPEYHEVVGEMMNQQKEEDGISISLEKAFDGEEFSRYISKQKPTFQAQMDKVIAAGTFHAREQKEVGREFATFHTKFEPILTSGEEILKWRNLYKQADEAAVKAEEESRLAFEKLGKAKFFQKNTRMIEKLEPEYERLKRAAEEARESANDTLKRVEEKEAPYKGDFVKMLTDPLQEYIDMRIKSANRLVDSAKRMVEAANGITDYEDQKIQPLKDQIAKLEEVEMTEFDGVVPIDPIKEFD